MTLDQLKEVGKRIRFARKNANLSQEQLAEKLNISPTYMSDIENGKTNVGLKIFMDITESLQVSADWLLQTNIPPVQSIHLTHLEEIFSDCSASEIRAIAKIIRDIQEYAKISVS